MQYITKCMWLTDSQYDCILCCIIIKSCAEVKTMNPIKLTNKELNSLLDDCQSVKKTIKISGGRTKYIWKRRVILNSDGNPIGIEQYMVQSGERIFLTPIKIERNTREEVKVAKANYAEEMKRKFGSNWKSEKRGATIKLTSFRQLSMLLK